MFCADNTENLQVSNTWPHYQLSFLGRVVKGERLKKSPVKQTTKYVVRPEDFIWLEMSMVPQVESVFVDLHGNSFRVTTVVNDRDPELRRRIFARERAIIDELANYNFEFDILTRMGRELGELVSKKAGYSR